MRNPGSSGDGASGQPRVAQRCDDFLPVLAGQLEAGRAELASEVLVPRPVAQHGPSAADIRLGDELPGPLKGDLDLVGQVAGTLGGGLLDLRPGVHAAALAFSAASRISA